MMLEESFLKRYEMSGEERTHLRCVQVTNGAHVEIQYDAKKKRREF